MLTQSWIWVYGFQNTEKMNQIAYLSGRNEKKQSAELINQLVLQSDVTTTLHLIVEKLAVNLVAWKLLGLKRSQQA